MGLASVPQGDIIVENLCLNCWGGMIIGARHEDSAHFFVVGENYTLTFSRPVGISAGGLDRSLSVSTVASITSHVMAERWTPPSGEHRQPLGIGGGCEISRRKP